MPLPANAEDTRAASPANRLGASGRPAVAGCLPAGADIAPYQRTKPISSTVALVNSINGNRSTNG